MIEPTDDPTAFAAAVGEWLAPRARYTVLATVLDGILHGRHADPPPRFAVVRDGEGAVSGAALRTPPWPLLCTEVDPAQVDPFLDVWLAHDPGLAGASGPPATVRAIGDAWCRRTGGTHRLQTAMALHALESVTDPPHPTTGLLRLAGPADEDTVLAWSLAFDAEAHGHDDPRRGEELGRALLSGGRAYVWDDGGAPVSFLGHTIAVDGIQRIGPVYTPPECRGHGYAGHAVAELSRRLLAGGARRCVLNTDLANPTSNKIYAEVGYRRFAEWETRAFVPPGAQDAPVAGQTAAESPTTG